jgi:hypothetical protein
MIALIHAGSWFAAFGCLAVAVTGLVKMGRSRDAGDRGSWIIPVMFGCGAIVSFTVAGALSVTAGAVLAVATFAALAMLEFWPGGSKRAPRDHARNLTLHAVAGIGGAARDARGAVGWIRRRVSRAEGDAPIPVEAVAAAVASRGIPSVREDPHLGVPPEPAALATAAPVPHPYAALAQFIRDFEPSDDLELRAFMEACAAGDVALADAWHAHADLCLNTAGLHPAYVAGILEVGDTKAESAAVTVQAHKRFAVIYGAVKEWISGHGPLPHKAREFLTGE